MTTKKWKCYVSECLHIGETSEFVRSVNGPECPKCHCDEATFPHRRFRCLDCGLEKTQDEFFGEYSLESQLEDPRFRRSGKDDELSRDVPLDPDPMDEDWERICAELQPTDKTCKSTRWEQIE